MRNRSQSAGEGLRETCLASSQEKLGQFQPSAQYNDEVSQAMK